MKEFVSIGSVARILGVSLSTVYRRLKAGLLREDFRTSGGHRRFGENRILAMNHAEREEITMVYSRVSSSDQKEDLERQAQRLLAYATNTYPASKILDVRDLGSGLNYKKKGLNLLLKLIVSKGISRLALNHKIGC